MACGGFVTPGSAGVVWAAQYFFAICDMSYLSDYTELREGYVREVLPSHVCCGQFAFTRWSFESEAQHLMPGHGAYHCREHGVSFQTPESGSREDGFDFGDETLRLPDSGFESNRRFEYRIFAPAGNARFDSAILLLHGLNEQHWEKCLPWALGLLQRTGRPLILMPLSMHMNRATGEWCQSRRMQRVAQHRQAKYADLTASSFSNAAISARLHARPERFFWSAMQSCKDVIALARSLRSGGHRLFREGARLDLFGYSIGAFLSQLLLMADTDALFSSTKAFLFCGGPTVDRMRLADRAILDSAAEGAIKKFFCNELERNGLLDPRLGHYLGAGHPLGQSFRMLLSYDSLRDEREAHFRLLAKRMAAVLLTGDSVVSPLDTIPVLRGERKDIGIDAAVMDFPYPYSHIMPFPLQVKFEADVETALNAVLDRAAAHLA